MLRPKEEEEEERTSAMMQSRKGKKRSAPSQPDEATMRPKKEKKPSATCRRTLTSKDRTLAEVTFAVAHRISTTVTHSSVVVAEWINETVNDTSGRYGGVGPRRRRLVGLEVACRRNGYIALIQLCVGDRCLIYQPLHSADDYYPGPRELFAFLNDDRYCFVAAGVDEIAYRLEKDHSFEVRNSADLGDMAASWLQRKDLRRAGLEQLAREVMGLEMDTPAEVRVSEWWRQNLSRQQIAYACVDAFVSFRLGRLLFGG